VKVLAVVGSARKKNTFSLTEAVIAPIKERKDVTIELIQLSSLDIKHCAGCDDYCKNTGECKTQDDMQKLYPKLKDADVLIIGSPTYFWNVSGLIKNFMDRCLPLYYQKALKGKKGAAVAVSEIDGQNRTLSAISGFFQLLGMKELGSVSIARGEDMVGEAEFEMAKALGKRIVNQLTKECVK
jgi:multimeric flavodoxin WrbA